MQEIDNFKKIFDYTPTESTTVINLDESGAKAKIRHLNVLGGGVNLVSFDEGFSNKVGNLFLKSSLCTKNADGIIVFENAKGKYLLLCEMKSSGGGVFQVAFQQMFSSYMKMCMLLSMCDDFKISNFHVFFLFTSKDGSDLAMILNELEQIDVSQLSFEEKVRLDLLRGKYVKFKLNKVPHYFSFLHRDFTDHEVVCQLVKSSTDTIDFDINSIP